MSKGQSGLGQVNKCAKYFADELFCGTLRTFGRPKGAPWSPPPHSTSLLSSSCRKSPMVSWFTNFIFRIAAAGSQLLITFHAATTNVQFGSSHLLADKELAAQRLPAQGQGGHQADYVQAESRHEEKITITKSNKVSNIRLGDTCLE